VCFLKRFSSLKILDHFEGTAAILLGTAMPTVAFAAAAAVVVSTLHAATNTKINSGIIIFISLSF